MMDLAAGKEEGMAAVAPICERSRFSGVYPRTIEGVLIDPVAYLSREAEKR